ncbi:MAG: PEP-CTERM sorting domain-containing protein [Candidatus Thiodiazotropha sp.]
MKTTSIYSKWLVTVLAWLLISFQAQALMLEPDDASASTSISSNLTTLSDINSAFGTTYSDLMLLWKGETDSAPAGQDGSLADSYLWNVADPANGGTIDHVGGEPAADCPTCFLIVKDGRSDIAQYLFDLNGWDGIEQIVLRGFWPNKEDAISNVAIWGGMTEVPEPGALLLLSLGLLGLVYSRKSTT